MKSAHEEPILNYQDLPGYHIITDKNANIIDVSKDIIRLLREEKLLSHSGKIQDVVGKNIYTVLNIKEEQKDSLQAHFVTTIKESKKNHRFRSNRTEVISFDNDHRVFSLQSRASVTEKEVLFYTTANDITELVQKTKELEIKTEEAEKAKEEADKERKLKSAFLANMSHEVRTPMNGIIGFCDLLYKKLSFFLEKGGQLSPENIKKLIGFAQIPSVKGHELLKIISDILDISKLEAGHITINPEEVQIHALCDEIQQEYSLLCSKKNISFYLHIDPSLDKLFLDPLRIKQILGNLVNNALKFTKEGGNISLSIVAEEEFIVFSVADTGIGIEESKLDLIFESFRQAEEDTTRKYGGTGLGLSLVKKFIDLMKGDIRVDSALEKGSTFSFSLPLIRPAKKLNGAHSSSLEYLPESNNLLQDKTILVVEDDDMNAYLLQEYIEDQKGSFVRAANRQEVMHHMEKENIFDLILMDVQLPEKSGFDITREILLKYPQTKIIIQTAYAQASDKHKAFSSGAIDYISKPVASNVLYEKCKIHLSLS